MLRFQRNSGFKLLLPRRFQPRGRFANFHVCLFVKLAAGPFWQRSACFSLFTTFQLPKWPGIDFPTFPWSFPARLGYLWTKIDRNRRFGCNLTRFSLIAYTSLSNPSLPFSRQTNDIFCKFFLNFQGLIQPPPCYRGKKLVEFDLDLLEITQILKFLLFLPVSLSNASLPFPCIRTIWHQFNFFNPFLFVLVCCYFIFHSGLSKRNFWCKEHCSSSKIGRVTAIWRYFYNSSADQFASNLT